MFNEKDVIIYKENNEKKFEEMKQKTEFETETDNTCAKHVRAQHKGSSI